MKEQSAAYWENMHGISQKMLIEARIDLENYRCLVQRLKQEINHWRNEHNYIQQQSDKMEKQIKETLFENLQYEYYHSFKN